IQYHPGKANVVADALSKKSGMIVGIKHDYWASLRIKPDLISRIKEAQKEDSEIWTVVENLDKQRRHDAIWVVVDRLTKSAHFLPIRKDYFVSRLAKIFQQEIVRLHGNAVLQFVDHVGERVIKRPEMIEVTNAKVAVAKENLKEARTRQK
nr:hypothetical protein [Tanacetum cinerariifolium]